MTEMYMAKTSKHYMGHICFLEFCEQLIQRQPTPVVLKCEIGLISRNQNEMRNRPFFNNLKANW